MNNSPLVAVARATDGPRVSTRIARSGGVQLGWSIRQVASERHADPGARLSLGAHCESAGDSE